MGECRHVYPGDHAPCPHAAVDGSDVCLWHNPHVRKHDPYVPALLEAADRTATGDLDGFLLAGLIWPTAVLPGRSLRHADLRDAVLDGADLSGADLSNANLRRASLKRARLAKAMLVGANLSSANLTGADLREADLRRAVLNATVLNGADLTGADLGEAVIEGFHWNERTRFTGIRGLDDPGFATEDDETRHCAAPLTAGAMGSQGPASALDDPDPEREATRTFAITPPSPVRPGTVRISRPWPIAAGAIAAGLVVGGLITWFAKPTGIERVVAAADARLAAENLQLVQQGEAYAARINELEDGARNLLDAKSRLEQEVQQAKAEGERLRNASRRSAGDAARLRGADDRAALLAEELERTRADRDRLSGELARQLKLGAILSDGVQRLGSENREATAKAEEMASAASHVPLLSRQLGDARDELARTREERDAWRSRASGLGEELADVRGELARYIARVQGTGLQDYLTTDTSELPLIPVRPGQPVALGGDYCLTLRVDPGTRTGSVQAALTVQRPSALANPDVAVLLYDQDGQVLRRIAWSFPHVDGGAPVVAATSTVACDRFPAFARVLVSPAVETARK